MVIRALVFDFDGLILETEGAVYQSWRELFQAHGHDLPLSVWSDCIGRPEGFYDAMADLEKLAGQPLDRDALLARQRQRHYELLEAEEVLPGVEALIQEARDQGLKLAVASSSSQSWVTGHLARLGLNEPWNAICCRDDVVEAKPAPDLYLCAVRRLGVEPNEAIALEDSPNGAWAAKRAGLFCVAIPNSLTAQLGLDHADLRLTSLRNVSLAQLMQAAGRQRAAADETA